MDNIALRMQNISKSYNLRRNTFSLTSSITHFFRHGALPKKQVLQVLKGISFEVKQGEVFGIIGKNGAGKSTLLKICSQITVPSQGSLEIYGSISSLLELGAGFHPELTGRENIFLNGSLLGMSREHIKERINDIISFSNLSKFIDMPLKKYSSGMYLRLAFSVAAFLDTEILLLDEILAVGDSVFQQKCVNKIFDLKHQKKTIIIVSHNLSLVKSMCNRVIFLEDGKIKAEGSPEEVINAYTQINQQEFSQHILLTNYERSNQQKSELLFTDLYFDKGIYFSQDSLTLQVKLATQVEHPIKDIFFGIDIYDVYNNNVYHLSNLFLNQLDIVHDDEAIYEFHVPMLQLKSGTYQIDLYVNGNDVIQDWIKNQIVFVVETGNIYNFGKSAMIKGVVQPHFTFRQINKAL